MSRQILSIDIRNNSIAAVVLNTGLKSSTIEACAQISLPEDIPEENRLGAGLAALLQHGIPSNATVVASLPADRTIYRTVLVPFKEEKKIRQVLPFELEPNLPIAVDELVIDFQRNSDQGKTGLLTTAIDRHYLEYIMAAMTAANMRPQLVMPGDFPLALYLTAYCGKTDERAILLNVGTRRTTLFALKDKSIALVRSLASDVASEAGVEALALKIRQTLTAFADSDPDGFTPKTLHLSGPALNAGASARLAKALDLPPQAVDLRPSAPKLDAATLSDQWHPYIFDNALAMALIEAEGRPCPTFHRSSSPVRKYWTTYRPYIRGPAVLLAVVLLLSLAGVLLESHLLKKSVDQVNAKAEALFAATFPQSRRVGGDVLEQMKSELKKAKSNSIDPGQTVPEVRTIDILFQLSQLIPKEVDVVFSRLVLGNDGLTLSGETAAFNIVDDVKGRLEKSDLFKQVTIASADMDKGGNKVHFKLKIDL
ncbi:MAG: hypothetical protein C4519_23060 [Desulfobacteraceae bacterium]|nr:MAG: hypothetical protein C4519_23060 [Desulfobacteraceae bacterium]